jgi:predicted nuclease of predicted toxin-antitoxin system
MLKILFDHCTPAPLRQALRARGHEVTTCFELHWNQKPDAALLAMAEEQGFDVLLTADQNLRYQQNLAKRKISIVVLKRTNWPLVKTRINDIVAAAELCFPGSYCEIDFAD